MNHASLFSGIGGFDLAAEWMGWTNVLHVERDLFCQRVLKHHFPNSLSFDDVKTFDGRPFWGRIDILTGGFPCQPYSSAGKRMGKDDERHLWPEMRRIISEIAPTFVVGENVRGLTNWNGGLVFEEVCVDLEALGYEVWTGIIPAAGVGAPHRRDRIWFVAHAHGRTDLRTPGRDAGKSASEGIPERDEVRISNQSSHVWDAADTDCRGLERAVEIGWNGVNVERQSQFGDAPNTHGSLLQCRDGEGASGRSAHQGERAEPLGKSAYWEVFPTQPPVCGGDDGLPRELDGITFSKWRAESIKAYGNAIVPQVAYEIFQAIQEAK